MISLDSPEDRTVTVKTFINARYNKIARITTYEPLARYLNGKHIEVLYDKLPKSGPPTQTIQILVAKGMEKDIVPMYTESDAKMYLDWLISVVQGFSPSSTNQELVNKAFDQLSNCILILVDATEWDNNKMLSRPYDWTDKLCEFEEEISNHIKTQVEDINRSLETYQYKISGYSNKLDEISEYSTVEVGEC